MHEEQMSDEEASDSEIVLVDRSPSPGNERYSSGMLDVQETQTKFATEEMKIDEQLKALGLFEEGMSIEQKEELLTVLEHSRETAQQEETRRKEAKEWEQQVYFSQGSKIEFHPCEQSPESSNHDVELCCLNTSENSENPSAIDRIKRGNIAPLKSSETLVTQQQHGKNFEVLDLEDPETGESQTATAHQNPAFSPGVFYSRNNGSCSRSSVHSGLEKQKAEKEKRGVRRLSRSAYHPSASNNSKVAVAHPIVRESMLIGSHASCEDEDMSDEEDDANKAHELEKNMASWRPCTSPVAPALKCGRSRVKPSLEFENVPYFCMNNTNPKDYSKVILKSLNNSHMYLRKIQESSSNYIPWGKPIRVGRHHLDTLDMQESPYKTRSVRMLRTRTVPNNLKQNENEDEVYAEEEIEDFDDSGNSTLPNVCQVSETECNTIVRTVKSAFHPTTIFSKELHGEGHASRKSEHYEHHLTQPNDLDDVHCTTKNENMVNPGTSRNRRRRVMHEISREENCEDNSSRLALWSPFGPSGDLLIDDNKCSSRKYSNPSSNAAGGDDKNDKKVLSTEYTLSSTLSTNLRPDSFFLEDKTSDSTLFVRKDGQRTYASKQSQSSLSLSSEGQDNIQACNSQESSGSKGKPEQPLRLRSSDGKIFVDQTSVDEIEQRGISRKRKCEVRLKKLSSNEIKSMCSGKRLKE